MCQALPDCSLCLCFCSVKPKKVHLCTCPCCVSNSIKNGFKLTCCSGTYSQHLFCGHLTQSFRVEQPARLTFVSCIRPTFRSSPAADLKARAVQGSLQCKLCNIGQACLLILFRKLWSNLIPAELASRRPVHQELSVLYQHLQITC